MAHEGPCTLVGAGFAVGENPQVSGQFNVRYCVANAIVRKSSRLEHFTNEAVTDPTVGALAARIETRLDPALMEGKFENASRATVAVHRSEEHTSELQSLMRISYAVFCLKKKKNKTKKRRNDNST